MCLNYLSNIVQVTNLVIQHFKLNGVSHGRGRCGFQRKSSSFSRKCVESVNFFSGKSLGGWLKLSRKLQSQRYKMKVYGHMHCAKQPYAWPFTIISAICGFMFLLILIVHSISHFGNDTVIKIVKS